MKQEKDKLAFFMRSAGGEVNALKFPYLEEILEEFELCWCFLAWVSPSIGFRGSGNQLKLCGAVKESISIFFFPGGGIHWLSLDFFFLINFFILFIYFWLCWVFIAVRRLSLVVESRGYSLLRCAGFSLWCAGFSSQWLLL